MASADEIRKQIDEGHAALKAAIEGADASKWETVGPGNPEWSPRQIAEHAIGSEVAIAGGVANAMMGKPPERKELALANPAEAMAALEEAVEASTKVTRYVEDRDLEKRVGENSTIQGMMELLGTHAVDHANEITASA
jgi:hypothetical protein